MKGKNCQIAKRIIWEFQSRFSLLMRVSLHLIAGIAVFVLANCTTETIYLKGYGVENSDEEITTTIGLDYRDFEYAAEKAVASFLISAHSKNNDGETPWVMAISRVINDTAIDIDMDQLIKKIRISLLESGRVVVTTAVGLGTIEDPMTEEIRKLRENPEFDQETVTREASLVAPDLSLSGKVIQRANSIGRKQQVDYYFQLTVTNLDTGLVHWEFEEVIAKLGANEKFPWS